MGPPPDPSLLVFGSFAEASRDVHTLVNLAARALARKHWRSMGSRTEQEARSWWVARCRRTVGTVVARAYARYQLRRLLFVGVPRAVLDAHRDERAQRGVAGGAGDRSLDADLQAFWAHQVHVRANAA